MDQQRRDETALRHMLEFAREAAALASGRERADLDGDRLFELAMTRLVELIGEAASRVSEERRARHPDVPWRAMTGMRNRLIHGYDTVQHDILWQTLKVSVPALIGVLELIPEANPVETDPRE